jgi:hypothetical protein
MPRQPWRVRCGAHRSTDGQRCTAWAIRGGYVCVKHGGRAPQVRGEAEFRLAWDRAWLRYADLLGRALRELDRRMATEPDVVRAQTLAYLREGGRRLAEFRAVNGRGPRNAAERRLILPP